MRVGYVYHAGKRVENEDGLLFRSTLLSEGELAMAVLCDGMGGSGGGKEACMTFLKEAEHWYETQLLRSLVGEVKKEKAVDKVIQAKAFKLFYEANRSMFLRMRKETVEYGTTVVLCVFYKDRYYAFHLGDSRLYRIDPLPAVVHVFFGESRKCRIRKLTRDHGDGHGVSRCMGLNPEWKPDMKSGRIKNSSFLFCSDGFYRRAEEPVWERSLCIPPGCDESLLSRRLSLLAEEVERCGEKDNISALLVTK